MKNKINSKKQEIRYSIRFYKEIVMSMLALLSVFFVIYEYLASPDYVTKLTILRFDLVVAIIFLIDFCSALISAKDKVRYIVESWYLLLAAIPIIDGWAELLRGLRVLELVRLVRVGSHLTYVYETVKPKK